MINLISIILSLLLCQSIFPKDREISLSGTIQNFHGNKLPYATVRINNSGMGTVSDEYGIFKISLSRGIIDVTFSYVGYQSQSMRIILEQDTSIIAVLNISEIQMPEVMVVGEDPAYGIIREAIFRKNKWKAKLESYSAKVYTKDTFGTDSALGMISEAYSDIYWNRGDSLKEVVSYRRQSTNIPKEFQYALVRDFINFNDDSIHQWGYTFIAPLADSAFQYYDYHLIETSTRDDHVYYTIEVIPLTQIEPLFVGRIIIQDSSFALHRVVLNPNRIFTIPFMDIQNYEITEQYSLYDNQYWFPLEYHIRTNIKIRYILLNLPNLFHYTKSVVCYKYLPNTPICDSMKLQPNTTFLSSAQNYDTTE